MLYFLAIILLKLPLLLIKRPKVYGKKENLKIKGGVIFICNHQNLLDPLLIAILTPRIIRFMAKSELFESKIGRWFFRGLFVFPVNRNSADLKSVRRAISILNEGKAFGIFPEGRRSVTDEMDDFEKGPAFIAAKSKAPVVPMYISPATYKPFGRLKVIIGDVIRAEDIERHCEKRMVVESMTNEMQNSMNELSFELRRLERKQPRKR